MDELLALCTVSLQIRDVNETRDSRSFFSILGKEFLDFPELRTPDKRPIVSGIIFACRSALAISRSLVCFTMARTPDARTLRN